MGTDLRKTLLIGAKGQLGSDLVKCLPNTVAWDIDEIDITDLQRAKELVSSQCPDVIINTAAYHKLEECEANPDKAFQTNTVAVKNLAEISDSLGAILVHISTDYVFDGKKSIPYVESDQPNPLNFYGLSKYAGEIAIANNCEKYYICRVASLFGIAGSRGKGGNFIETMITKAKRKELIKVIDDITMSPTSTLDFSHFLNRFLDYQAPFGIYHMTNTEYCSWFEFAKTIFEELKLEANLIPIKYAEINSSIKRPKLSALSSERIQSLGLKPMQSWRRALRDYLLQKGYLTV